MTRILVYPREIQESFTFLKNATYPLDLLMRGKGTTELHSLWNWIDTGVVNSNKEKLVLKDITDFINGDACFSEPIHAFKMKSVFDYLDNPMYISEIKDKHISTTDSIGLALRMTDKEFISLVSLYGFNFNNFEVAGEENDKK